MSMVLHAAGFGAALMIAAPSFTAPQFTVESGRTAIELSASLESSVVPLPKPLARVQIDVAPDDVPPEPRESPHAAPKQAAALVEAVRQEFSKPVRPTELSLALAPPLPAQPAARAEPQERRDAETAPQTEAFAAPRRKSAAPPPPEMVAVSSAASAASQQTTGAAVDELPQALPQNPPPPYTREAHRAKFEGVVALRVVVGPSGRPISVDIYETCGNASLDHSALRTVRDTWRFRPAYRDGRPVEYVVVQDVEFRIRDGD